MLRHKVKPGITGWAQINGWRGETDTLEKMEKRVEFDLEYIREWERVVRYQNCFSDGIQRLCEQSGVLT
ncbi:putative UDP-glucose lipid carrier transferase [Citrobacter braakii]|nr:putative UDP-glucose lipid carrier transferase [Citrobacter braakii]